MQEKSLNYVSPNWRDLYQKGCIAFNQGDLNNAIIIFSQILDEEPGLVECREALRKAQLLRGRNTGFLKHIVEEVCEVPELAEAETYLHSQPLKAVQAAEQVLNHIPTNILAHKILAQAALKASMPRTAMLSLNFILSHAPENLDVSLELADALAENADVSEAVTICGRLLKEHPGNKRVTRALSRLYKLAHDRRTDAVPRAREPLESLNISNSAFTSKKVPRMQKVYPDRDVPGMIRKYETLLPRGPKNLKVLKTLAKFYAQKSDFDRALEYCERAREVAYRTDPELENMITQITEKRTEALALALHK